jgi:hypothetical protein
MSGEKLSKVADFLRLTHGKMRATGTICPNYTGCLGRMGVGLAVQVV